jgi:hypothetical protein
MVFQDKLAWTICRNYTTGTISKKRTTESEHIPDFFQKRSTDRCSDHDSVIFLFMDQMDKMKLKKKTGHVNTVF